MSTANNDNVNQSLNLHKISYNHHINPIQHINKNPMQKIEEQETTIQIITNNTTKKQQLNKHINNPHIPFTKINHQKIIEGDLNTYNENNNCLSNCALSSTYRRSSRNEKISNAKIQRQSRKSPIHFTISQNSKLLRHIYSGPFFKYNAQNKILVDEMSKTFNQDNRLLNQSKSHQSLVNPLIRNNDSSGILSPHNQVKAPVKFPECGQQGLRDCLKKYRLGNSNVFIKLNPYKNTMNSNKVSPNKTFNSIKPRSYCFSANEEYSNSLTNKTNAMIRTNQQKVLEEQKIRNDFKMNSIDILKSKCIKKIESSHSHKVFDQPRSHSVININSDRSTSMNRKDNNLILPIKLITQSRVNKSIKCISSFTHVGYDGEKDKENNQDSYFIANNFLNNKDWMFMAVCDGHGAEGHLVSGFVKKNLPNSLSNNLQKRNINDDNITHIVSSTFINLNERLREDPLINSEFSGSTCVSLIYTPGKLICANIGDSRAVLGRNVNGLWQSHELSKDHKPGEKDEARRIFAHQGRIQPLYEEGEYRGPLRVWVQKYDVPGLAMTRSFGDKIASLVGVISDPEITSYDFKPEDKFFILASDGVWDHINSQECVHIIKEFYIKNDIKGCCECLYLESKKRWIREEDVIDDITMIIVFLN